MDLGALLQGLGAGLGRGGETYLTLQADQKNRDRQAKLDDERRQQQMIDNALRDREQRIREAGIAAQSAEPDTELAPAVAAMLAGTPYAARLRTQNTLPSKSLTDAGVTDMPAKSSVMLKPTFEQQGIMDARREHMAQEAARKAVETQYSHSNDPSQRAYGQAIGAGVQPPPMSFEDQVSRAVKQAQAVGQVENKFALQRIAAQNQGKMFGFDGGMGGGPGGSPAPDLHGDQFLSTIKDPKVQTLVKQLANYEGILPSASALRSPMWLGILSAAKQYDPTFDATNYATRAAMKKDFTSGKTAGNIRALNTATKHLSQLDEAMKSLGNSNFEPYNAVANPLAQAFGVGNVRGAKLDINALTGELANVFKQSGATDDEIKNFKDAISINAGPNNQANVMKEAIRLMQGRMDAINNQWTQTMGIPPKYNILSPEAQKVFESYTSGQPAAGSTTPKIKSIRQIG